jgi:hypothetical protein
MIKAISAALIVMSRIAGTSARMTPLCRVARFKRNVVSAPRPQSSEKAKAVAISALAGKRMTRSGGKSHAAVSNASECRPRASRAVATIVSASRTPSRR